MLIVAALALIVYLRTLAPTITWAHNGVDSGDFAAAVATQGIPHPTGYPTYVLLGRVFLLIPWGDQAHRLNVMSAVFAALTVALLYRVILQTFRLAFEEAIGLRERAIAAGGALAFAFSPVFWSQALITEVYTLNGFFVALTVHLALRWVETSRYEMLALTGLVFALGLGNHLTLALLAPALLLLLVLWRRRALGSLRSWRAIVPALGALVLGLSTYLYLPIRAAHHPPINWGDSHTWDRFVWLVTGRLYRRYVFSLPLRYLPSRLAAWAGLLVRQFGVWGPFLGLAGWWWLWQRSRKLALFSAVLFLGYSVYAIGYDTSDSQAYLIPAFLAFALWIAWGLELLLSEVEARLGGSRPWLRRVLPIGLALFISLIPLASHFAALDLSADREAHAYGVGVLGAVAPDAILIAQTDPHTFALWYTRYGEGRRPDVAVLAEGLLPYAWYRRTMADVHPGITVMGPALQAQVGPGEISGWAFAAVFEANRARHPIYVTDPDDRVRARYRLSPVGPVYQVLGPREG